MSSEPKISVIIPIYNTAEYLPRCLDSILNNTYQNLEIICVNDGSTDNSLIILEQYAAEDSRIVAVNQENAGVSAARNAGLDRATGDFIAFVDSDDWVHPQYFEVLMQFGNSEKADIVACNFSRAHQFDSNAYITYPRDEIACLLLPFEKVTSNGFLKRLVWGRLYAKNLINQLRFDRVLMWGEDTAFNLSALLTKTNLRFAWVDIPLYFYYSRDTSISNTISYERRFRLPKWYLRNFTKFNNKHAQKYILEQACKETLSSRYLEMFNPKKAEVTSACKSIIADCLGAMCTSGLFSAMELLKYRILFKFPFLYRLIRIGNDKTLLIWEKNEKIRQRTIM